MGRTRSEFHSHFEVFTKKTSSNSTQKRQKCLYCGVEKAYHPGRMVEHLEKCSKYKSMACRSQIGSTSVKSSSTVISLVEPDCTSGKSQRTTSTYKAGSTTSKSSVISFFHRPLEAETLQEIYRDLTEIIVLKNLPFSFFDDGLFLNVFKKLNCTFSSLPTRELVTRKFLPELHKNLEARVHARIIQMRPSSISITTDGWTDINGDGLHNIVLQSGGERPYLLDMFEGDLEEKKDHVCAVFIKLVKMVDNLFVSHNTQHTSTPSRRNCH